MHVGGTQENHTWGLGHSDIKESGGMQQPTGEEPKEGLWSQQQAKDEQSQEMSRRRCWPRESSNVNR